MKKSIIWVALLAGVVTTFNSCKEDPEPIPIIVGVWERDVYELTDLPANFQNFEGLETDGIYSNEVSYTLTINQDGTYHRKIERDPGSDITDDGKWVHESNNFTLNSDESGIDDEEFKVEEEITSSKLLISEVLVFNLLPDAVLDTLSDEWANAHPEELETYVQQVDVKVLFHFQK